MSFKTQYTERNVGDEAEILNTTNAEVAYKIDQTLHGD